MPPLPLQFDSRMPLVWLKKGDGVAQQTVYESNGLCCLQHLGLEKYSIALDNLRGFMQDGCQFCVTRFREETSEARGSTADLAIVVTGTAGIQLHQGCNVISH